MNEAKFKQLVRKQWLPEYWSECLELRDDLGFPDVHFLGPKGTVTLVEFKVVRQRDVRKEGFLIPWRRNQPVFAAEYVKHGGKVGALVLTPYTPLWLVVEPSVRWVRQVQRPLTLECPWFRKVDHSNIRDYIQE